MSEQQFQGQNQPTQFQGQPQGGYPQAQAPMYIQNSPEQLEGGRAAQSALIFGILGLFFLGIVFGPIAIVKANAAEKLNVPATAGKVLGWISTVFGIFGLIWFIIMVVGFFAAVGSSTY